MGPLRRRHITGRSPASPPPVKPPRPIAPGNVEAWQGRAVRTSPGFAEGKPPEAELFGEHWRDWVRKWVQRICEAAGVPVVTAHGMRGFHSTLAVEHGGAT